MTSEQTAEPTDVSASAVDSTLARIVARDFGTLRLRARAWVGDDDEAKDLVQAALLRALEHPPRMMGTDAMRAWLFVVMRNLAIDRARSPFARRGPQPVLTAPSPDDLEPPRPSRPELDLAEIRAAIAELAAPQRAVFERYLRGESYREIARQLHLRVATVGTRIHRAKRALAPVLARRLSEEAAHEHAIHARHAI